MSKSLIAERYADGLSSALPNPNDLEPVLASLKDLLALYHENAELRSALTNPAIRVDLRRRVLDEVLAAIDAPPLAAEFARTMFDRNRIGLLPEAVGTFERIADKRLGKVRAIVTTAVPLRPEQSERLRTALSAYAAKDVRIVSRVDAAIAGGVVVEMDGRVLDGSLRARLLRMKHAVLTAEEI